MFNTFKNDTKQKLVSLEDGIFDQMGKNEKVISKSLDEIDNMKETI